MRITAPDDIAQELLPGPLAVLRERYPDLRLELAIDNQLLNLTHREADIALRPTSAPDESLVGRSISAIASGLYCAAGKAGAWRAAPEAAPWIGWEEGRGPAHFARYRAERWPGAKIVYSSSSMLHQARAAAEGLGLALLPCFLADADPRLTALEKPLPPLEAKLWLLTHADLRSAPRIRACLDLLYEELKKARGRLSP